MSARLVKPASDSNCSEIRRVNYLETPSFRRLLSLLGDQRLNGVIRKVEYGVGGGSVIAKQTITARGREKANVSLDCFVCV